MIQENNADVILGEGLGLNTQNGKVVIELRKRLYV
jgi:hypothetical protein